VDVHFIATGDGRGQKNFAITVGRPCQNGVDGIDDNIAGDNVVQTAPFGTLAEQIKGRPVAVDDFAQFIDQDHRIRQPVEKIGLKCPASGFFTRSILGGGIFGNYS